MHLGLHGPGRAVSRWRMHKTVTPKAPPRPDSPPDDAVSWRARLDLWEPHIGAFVALCPETDPVGAGPLSGLVAGVKDVIDVAGQVTRNGSAACADLPPASRDAEVVAALRAAGARIAGKTVTTEFAFTDPTDCRNPHDITRSPGGSSSGSGAAVAAGLVDIALGTQTAGSLCRPAAYCGVVGLKPGYGVLSRRGVTPLAPSFDSVGVIARSVGVARAAFEVMSGQPGASPEALVTAARWLLPGDVQAGADMLEALDEAMHGLSRCAAPRAAPPVACDTQAIVEAHRTVMLAEAAQWHGGLASPDKVARLRPNFRAALERGAALEATQVAGARRLLHEAAEGFWQAMQGVDVILTLPVPEGAPKLDGSTGFQHWLTIWTVFGGPLVSLPWGVDRLGRPRAVMLAGRPGTDAGVLALAERLEACAPPLPVPVLPAV